MSNTSTKVSLLKIILNFMDKWGKIIKENGLISSLFSFLSFIAIYIIIFQPQMVNNLIQKHLIAERETIELEHSQGIEYREKMNEQIPLLLTQLINSTGGERAMLLEAHNGGASIIGLPFLKISATYEELSYRYQMDDSQTYLLKEYKDEAVSQFQDLFEYIIEYKYLIIHDINQNRDLIGNYLYKRFQFNNVGSAFFAGIFDVNDGSLIGVVLLTSDKPNVFKAEVIATEMVDKVQVVSYYLNVFNANR